MSCCFCISISGPGPNLTRTWPRSGTDWTKVAFMRCCCLCRNYLNEITRTYTAEMPDEALSWARLGLGLDLTWCRCSCCSFVCFAVKSWRSNFFSLFAANNIVNCFRFSALMGITTDRHCCAFAFDRATLKTSSLCGWCNMDKKLQPALERPHPSLCLSICPSSAVHMDIYRKSLCVLAVFNTRHECNQTIRSPSPFVATNACSGLACSRSSWDGEGCPSSRTDELMDSLCVHRL